MQRIKRLYLLAFYLVFTSTTNAQQPWTLQQCIDYALAHNISIRQADLNKDLSKTTLDQSYAGFFPSLNGSAGHNYYFGRSIDPTSNQFTTSRVQSNSF